MEIHFHKAAGDGSTPPSARRPLPRPGLVRVLIIGLLAFCVIYAAYFWLIRRVVVGADEVMILIKKDGSRSLPGDQIIIPRPPDPATNAEAYAAWEKDYGDCNGILEQVYLPGTYFGFSPVDYERMIVPIGKADVAGNQVGVVVRKFGAPLPANQVIADESLGQRGPLAKLLAPGKYYEYANPFAYEIKLVDPVQIDPGNRGVVTLMAGKPAKQPNAMLVSVGEQGVQAATEPEGFVYANPFEKRIQPITVQSQRFEMSQKEGEIRFPSSDSFDIKLDGFVEWSIDPQRLPLTYVQYSEGGGLVEFLEDKVILPYARSFCRLVGSQYKARDFISGDTKLKFQQEFETKLREACAQQGIIVLQALVRDIVPPEEIKDLINEREIAKEQINALEQQIQVAKSQADLVTQTETGTQNMAIGDANTQVVTINKKAEQEMDVAITQAQQELSVMKLHLAAAQKEADALTARGQADASVILLQRKAEAEPLQQQVAAFGDGQAFAQYYFYQKVAPSIKSILTSTDGPFADIFRQFGTPAGRADKTSGTKVTGVQP
jgi:regulator of protease activity HflC (stomatin/prohibitin superfamily)